MKNLALLAARHHLNDFTRELKARSEREGGVLVKLRDGHWREIIFEPDEQEDGRDGGFASNNFGSFWFLDGSSATTQDWDLVEMAAAPVTSTEDENVLTLHRPTDEHLDISLNGDRLGSFNHDDHGRAAMYDIATLATALATALGVRVEEA